MYAYTCTHVCVCVQCFGKDLSPLINSYRVYFFINVLSAIPCTLIFAGEGLEWKHIPVKDEKPPSVDQVKEFATIVDEARRIGKVILSWFITSHERVPR